MHPIIPALLISIPVGLLLTYGAITFVNLRWLAILARSVARVRFPVLRDLLTEEVARVRREALWHPLRVSRRIGDGTQPGVDFYFQSMADRDVLAFEDPIDGTRRDIQLLDAIEAHNLQYIWPQQRDRIAGASSASRRAPCGRPPRGA